MYKLGQGQKTIPHTPQDVEKMTSDPKEKSTDVSMTELI